LSNHGLLKYYQLLRRSEHLVKQINQLKQDQNQLQQEIDLLSNNYRYIEKIAREKYQMGKKGEKIYIMTSPDKRK
jgi:cell division protein FtsL